MIKKKKRILAVALAALLLALLSVTAFADKFEPPDNPVLSNGIATWKPSNIGTTSAPNNYTVQLYKDGTAAANECGSEQTVNKDSLTYNFTALIEQYGMGEYRFEVKAAAEGVYSESSSMFSTPLYNTLSLSTAAYSFPAAAEGYTTTPAALTVTVTNSSLNATARFIHVGCSNSDFELTVDKPAESTMNDIVSGGMGSFTVQPKSGLALGTHTATITVGANNNATSTNVFDKTMTVSFTVTPPTAAGNASGGDTSAREETRDTFYGGEGEDNIKVKLPGGGSVEMTELSSSDADYLLLTRGQSSAPLMVYEITPSRSGEGVIMFYVGRQYAGQSFTVLHKLADGSIESFYVTCAENGYISVRVKEFSPFAVFAGKVGGGTAASATASIPEGNPDTGAEAGSFGLGTMFAVIALAAVTAIGGKRRG